MFKRSVEFFLVVMITISIFAGCGSQNQSTQVTTSGNVASSTTEVTPEKPAPTTATMMVFAPPQRKWDGSPLQAMVLEKFNLDLKLNILDEKSYNEKYPIMVAAGNLPDAATCYEDAVNVNSEGDKGLFLNVRDKLDKLPTLKGFMEKYEAQSKTIISDAGKIYLMPKVNDEKAFWNAMIVRGDVLEKAGIDKNNIKTMDDLYAMFQAIQKTSGKNGFYGNCEGLYGMTAVAYAWGGISGGTRYWDFDKNEWTAGYTKPAYKDMVKFFARMYEDNMVNKDFLTMQKKAWLEECYKGNILAFAGGISYIDELNKEMQKTDPSVKWTWIKMPAYNGTLAKWESDNNFVSWGGIVINPKTKVADALLPFIDWLYTEEGNRAFNFGKEGETYIMQDGIPHWLRKQDMQTVSSDTASKATWLDDQQWTEKQNAWPLDITSLATIYGPESTFLGKHLAPYGQPSTQEQCYEDLKDVYAGPVPPKPFAQEEADEVSNIKNSIETYGMEWTTNAVIGKIDIDSEWDKFVKDCNDMGMEKMVKIHNDSYQRFFNRK